MHSRSNYYQLNSLNKYLSCAFGMVGIVLGTSGEHPGFLWDYTGCAQSKSTDHDLHHHPNDQCTLGDVTVKNKMSETCTLTKGIIL